MLDDPSVKKGIFAGIVASLLVILLIQPILILVGKIIIWLGNNLYEGISNQIYYDASLGLREKYSFLILTFIFAFIIFIFYLVIRILLFPEKIKKSSLKEISFFRKIILILIFISGLVISLFLMSANFVAFQMNASFNQRYNVLAPVLTDIQLKQFKAKWASMENRKDYENINIEMEKISNNNHIKLPKLLWK
jgi:hypothetical protein